MTQDPPSPVDPWRNIQAPVEEDMRFQRRFWAVQRIGWGLLALTLAAALLGAFSEGPLSRARVQGDGLEVRYERVYRHAAASPMQLVFPDGGRREVVVSHALLEKLDFETVVPAPERAETHPDGLHLTFGGDGPATVYINVRPGGVGPLRGEIALAGGSQPVPIHSFILP